MKEDIKILNLKGENVTKKFTQEELKQLRSNEWIENSKLLEKFQKEGVVKPDGKTNVVNELTQNLADTAAVVSVNTSELVIDAKALADQLANKSKALADELASKSKAVAGEVADKSKTLAGEVADKSKAVAAQIASETSRFVNDAKQEMLEDINIIRNSPPPTLQGLADVTIENLEILRADAQNVVTNIKKFVEKTTSLKPTNLDKGVSKPKNTEQGKSRQ